MYFPANGAALIRSLALRYSSKTQQRYSAVATAE